VQVSTRELAFLFTDIEGSTALLHQFGPQYAPMLDAHRGLIGDAIARAGGRVVDRRGDEFFAAFPDLESASTAAIAAQQALGAATWPAGARLRVRMGIHSGRAQVVGDGFVGLAVHHTSRICASARGGEILSSAVVAGVEAVDLGEHALKGIPRKTRLFRLLADGLERDFPPLGSPRAGGATPLRIALADDSVLLREGIASLLEDQGFEVVGQSCTAEDLLTLVDESLPDLAIVDIRMPPTKTDEGLRAAREIRERHPATGVLLLSQYVEVESAVKLFAEDANGLGYLLKDRVADIDEFTAAVRRVAGGGTAIDEEILGELRAGMPADREHPLLLLGGEPGRA
jgi:class 3 adenylate cyclase/DNA-binding NarL/FixJ family response regulator